MKAKNKMIYEFKNHCLYYEDENKAPPFFSLMLNTLELEYEMKNGKLIGISGFLPLVKAMRCSISLNGYEKGNIYLKDIQINQYQENFMYDILEEIPEIKRYFENQSIKYDNEKGIIQLGVEITSQDKLVKVDDNILCGMDSQLNLKSIYLIPTEFKK